MDKYARFRFQPCLPLGKDGRCVTASADHAAIARETAAAGMVLLKNENQTLPLPKGEKIALFGKATLEYIKGGGGSGDVHCPYVRNIFDGFLSKEAEGKVGIYRPLIDFYDAYIKRESVKIPTEAQINATWDIVNNMEFCQLRDDMTYDTFDSMHVKEAPVPEELIDGAAAFADTAIFTVSRFSAEGTDRHAAKGDWYLSDVETDVLDSLCKKFKKVVVIINSGATMDCEYFAENDKIGALLFGWQGGMEGGMAIADLLCGDVTPSGKLADTIPVCFDAYPFIEDYKAGFDHLDYTDDIFVGYRYFETVPGGKEKVRYPFGFGLSYTRFAVESTASETKDGTILVLFRVKNTGTTAGREVVQVYMQAPQNKISAASRVLVAFRKTKLLLPGETEEFCTVIHPEAFASFDDTGMIKKSAFVLEKGTYTLYAGTDVRQAEAVYAFELTEDRIISERTSLCRPFRLEKRLRHDGTCEALPTGEEEHFTGFVPASGAKAPEQTVLFDDVGVKCTMDEFVAQFTVDELCDFVGGKGPVGVCNTGCFGGMSRLHIPAVPTADGPAGLRLDTATGKTTTCMPCATLQACTWDEELVSRTEAAAAAELRENNLGVWLAPAMNIHRNPLCGRNFEYYAEDPLLAGKIASAAVRGIQSQKVSVALKHFACNNKEPNRFGCDSRLSERALREIYLRGFEICVKEAQPWAIMSSYNLINGQHTSESWELLTGILRNEWGFDGMVVTDWGVKNDPVQEVRAGNDMKMHCGYPDELKAAYEAGTLTRAQLELCVKRILTMFTKLV